MITTAILNFNGEDLIEECVESVLNQNKKPDKIIVIDNASTDDSWKLVEDHVDEVIHADNRYKFISGLNDAFDYSDKGWVLFMENDIRLHADCIAEMLSSKTHEESRGVIYNPTFYDQNGNKYKTGGKNRFLTACFMMHTDLFEFVGKFDENLAPAYYEDVDYSIRAMKMGFRIMKDFGRVIHLANYSFSKAFTKKQMSGWCRKNWWYVLTKHYLHCLHSKKSA